MCRLTGLKQGAWRTWPTIGPERQAATSHVCLGPVVSMDWEEMEIVDKIESEIFEKVICEELNSFQTALLLLGIVSVNNEG